MKAFFLESPSFSKEAGLQRAKRHIIPLLEEIAENQRKLIRCFYEEEAELHKELTIDKKNNLCINGTPVGDWRKISNTHTDGASLYFDYGNKSRVVDFGVFTCSFDTVFMIHEYEKNKAGRLISCTMIYITDKI